MENIVEGSLLLKYYFTHAAVNFNSQFDRKRLKWCILNRFLNIKVHSDKKIFLGPNRKSA